jgi:DNA-binding CsgD family transcriptional regulator
MNKRGRPPHPDPLTPREWEVLKFLRQRLSNEQIAERLGITLRTAKFHVSEILSKLAVETREQAAAWQPEEAPSQARRWLAWPLIARIASALIMVAAVAGLGLLALGVLRTSGDGRNESNPQGPARIESISPGSGTIGTQVVIRGSGFDVSGNDIGFTLGAGGTAYQSGVPSPDGATLRFKLQDTLGACAMSQVDLCPSIGLPLPAGELKVAAYSRNGISNAVSFNRELSGIEIARAAIDASPSMQDLMDLLNEIVDASYQPSSGTYLSSFSIGIRESDDGEVYIEVGIHGAGASAIRDEIPTEIAGYPVRVR